MIGCQTKKGLFLLLVAICTVPVISTAQALISGILFSLLLENPWPEKSSAWSQRLLQLSVVGLGFGLSIDEVWQVGKSSIFYTVVGIVLTLSVGIILGRLFKTGRNTAILIACGTAICGGSAIAAMSPVIKSEDDETAVALATVFTLNSVALLLFPLVGHFFNLSQHQFGVWAGLAIHDTSSVVGAATSYGAESLRIGTTVKLARAMWIAPLSMGAALLMKSGQRAKLPLFIVGFFAAATIRSLMPDHGELWSTLSAVARQSLVITLFLIGSGLSKKVLKKVGLRPLANGTTLWLLVSGVSLAALLSGWIN